MPRGRTKPTGPGEIHPDVLYRLDTLLARAGAGRHGYRQAVANGLTVHKAFGRRWVLGRDFIDYVQRREADA